MSGSTLGTPQERQVDDHGRSRGDAIAATLDGVAAIAIDAAATGDRHGRAALLLVESLLHALVARGVLKPGEVIDIIDIAEDVEAELAGAPDGESGETLLAPLARTFRIEEGE